MPTLYNAIQGRSLERLAALSDGIFAVAMTLLVLDIHIPSAEAIHSEVELCRALTAMAPQWIAYLMSFLTLGIFWAVPLTTRLLAEFITYRMALLLYWFNILLLGATLYWSWTYAMRHDLVKEETAVEIRGAICRRILIAQSLYAFGALLCVFSNYLSIAFIVLVQLNYAIAPWFGKRLG